MIDRAEIACDAYAEAVGGTTFDGKELPKFEDLGERQKWAGMRQHKQYWGWQNNVEGI